MWESGKKDGHTRGPVTSATRRLSRCKRNGGAGDCDRLLTPQLYARGCGQLELVEQILTRWVLRTRDRERDGEQVVASS